MATATATYSDLLYEKRDDGVLVITFNRPEFMNSLGGKMLGEFIDACAAAKEDDDVRCIVVTGSGRAFCAGADLSGGVPGQLRGTPSRAARLDRVGGAGTFHAALAGVDKPTIGAINGAAAGAGFGIACAMDIRIWADSARMSTVFVKRGLGPDYGSSYFLPRIVGMARAYELFFTGRFVNAEEALQIGLANRVVPADRLMDETLALAHEIAAGPPMALTFTRRALQESLQSTLPEMLRFEWTQQIEAIASEDAREGVLAWREKREPRFTGR
jgi:2-(1,2-epoxy-1,2-dihydrophenyl)acetyl-CoA isomerase